MLPDPSKAQILAALLAPNQFWTTSTITFSIPKLGSTWSGYGALTEPATVQFLNATQVDNFRTAIASVARIIDKPLVETDDVTQPGQIRIAFSDHNSVYGPPSGATATPQDGDIWLPSNWSGYTFGPGRVDGAQTYEGVLYQLGLTLGLNYTAFTLPIGYWNTTRVTMMAGDTAIDQAVYSFTMNPADPTDWAPAIQLIGYNGPMVYDILALQTLYGANKTTALGATTYSWDPSKAYFETIYDAGGVDTINLAGHARGSIIDLTPGAYSSIDYFSAADQKAYWTAKFPQLTTVLATLFDDPDFPVTGYQWKNNVGIAFGTIIENVVAGSGDDTVLGNDAANDIRGGAGNDIISGVSGDDTLTGGAGDDRLDGGAGSDTAIYTGPKTSYEITTNTDGSQTIKDLRAGSPDGTDTLVSVEHLVFAPPLPSMDIVKAEIGNILRQPMTAAAIAAIGQDLLTRWTIGTLNGDGVIAALVKAADATTSVATLNYQFFTGKIPTVAGLDYLVSSTGPNVNNLNSAYYQSFNLENRYINFAVNLGKVGEGKAGFAAAYGGLSLFDAAKKAYGEIFGATPTDTKVHALIDSRVDYFATYGHDGVTGIGTKAAMVGWLLAEAEKADVGVYARSNAAFLTDLADGAVDAVNLIGVYGKPEYVFGG